MAVLQSLLPILVHLEGWFFGVPDLPTYDTSRSASFSLFRSPPWSTSSLLSLLWLQFATCGADVAATTYDASLSHRAVKSSAGCTGGAAHGVCAVTADVLRRLSGYICPSFLEVVQGEDVSCVVCQTGCCGLTCALGAC